MWLWIEAAPGVGLRHCGQVTPDVRVLARFGRDSVLALRTRTRRRAFPAVLDVHRLPPETDRAMRSGVEASAATVGPVVATWEAPAAGTRGWDWHLRRDLVARLLEQAVQPGQSAGAEPSVLMAWTRPGPAERLDSDAAWWSAAHSACADVPTRLLGLAVVTRWGWWMLPEGPERRWRRLRAHSGTSAQQRPTATAHLGQDQSSGQV